MTYPALMKGMDGDAIACPKSSIYDGLGRAVKVWATPFILKDQGKSIVVLEVGRNPMKPGWQVRSNHHEAAKWESNLLGHHKAGWYSGVS